MFTCSILFVNQYWARMFEWYIISNQFHYLGGRDSSVVKLSASQSGDPGSNHGVGLTRFTQCMNVSGRDCQL